MPDAVAPMGGIGPSLPEHLIRERMAAEAAGYAAEEAAPSVDFSDIGPLPPGFEVVEELRHGSGRSNNTVSLTDCLKVVMKKTCSRKVVECISNWFRIGLYTTSGKILRFLFPARL